MKLLYITQIENIIRAVTIVEVTNCIKNNINSINKSLSYLFISLTFKDQINNNQT